MQATVIESSDPLQVLSCVDVTVKMMSLQLMDRHGAIATMSASMFALTLRTYQAMLFAECSVGSAGLVTPERDIIRTGALSSREANFLHLEYTSRPHETDIDHAVKVRMAPAYVTYDLAIFDRCRAFADVQGDETLDLSALGAQAATRLQEMQVWHRTQPCTHTAP